MVSPRIVLSAILLAFRWRRPLRLRHRRPLPSLSRARRTPARSRQDFQLKLEVRRVPVDVVVTDKEGSWCAGSRKQTSW